MIKPIPIVILAAVAIAAAAACATSVLPPEGETVPLLTLAKDPEAWRGREVRTCGPDFRGDRKQGVWELSRSSVSGYHPAIVRILGCGKSAPKRDRNGCVVGRIARRDGSIEPLREGEPRIVSSAIVSYDWYLHARCPASRRAARL
jgi:hypothetical protein